MTQIHPADPAARRVAMIVLAAGFLGGALLLWVLDTARPTIAAWLEQDPARTIARARMFLLAVGVVMGGPPLAAGTYLWRFGARVVDTRRFPPAGFRMVQDTLVLAGDAAVRRGRIAQAFGLMLIVAGLAMGALLWRLAPG